MNALRRLDAITIGERFRKDLGDMDALVASIESVGLLHPIVVMADDESNVTLVAGERRLRACQRLGWERIPVRMLPKGTDLLQAEHDENTVREPFAPSEAIAIAAALRPVEKAAAKERMAEAGKGGQIDQPSRAEDRIAAAVGMSRNTLAKAEAVVAAANADAALQPLVDVMDETHNVSGTHAALQALPPDPAPEQVQAAAVAVREHRKPDPLAPLTPEQAARFPEVAAADLSADLADAIAAIRTTKLDPAKWSERVERMRPEDIARLRQIVAHVHRWADEWDALLAPRPLSIVGGTK